MRTLIYADLVYETDATSNAIFYECGKTGCENIIKNTFEAAACFRSLLQLPISHAPLKGHVVCHLVAWKLIHQATLAKVAF